MVFNGGCKIKKNNYVKLASLSLNSKVYINGVNNIWFSWG